MAFKSFKLKNTAATMIRIASRKIDVPEELVASWLLSWLADRLVVARHELETVFTPDELAVLRTIYSLQQGTILIPPSKKDIIKSLGKDMKHMTKLIKELTDIQVLQLVLSAAGGKRDIDVYLTPEKFAKILVPRKGKTTIFKMLKQNKIPGAWLDNTVHPRGRWQIPITSKEYVEKIIKASSHNGANKRGAITDV